MLYKAQCDGREPTVYGVMTNNQVTLHHAAKQRERGLRASKTKAAHGDPPASAEEDAAGHAGQWGVRRNSARVSGCQWQMGGALVGWEMR